LLMNKQNPIRARPAIEICYFSDRLLDAMLRSLRDRTTVTLDDLARTAASERRRERRRARLRLVYLTGDELVGADPHDAFAAREALRVARANVSSHDWRLLCKLAEGYGYAELAAQSRSTPESLRVRVLRSRRRLADARTIFSFARAFSRATTLIMLGNFTGGDMRGLT
jgi:hypothetical protein